MYADYIQIADRRPFLHTGRIPKFKTDAHTGQATPLLMLRGADAPTTWYWMPEG